MKRHALVTGGREHGRNQPCQVLTHHVRVRRTVGCRVHATRHRSPQGIEQGVGVDVHADQRPRQTRRDYRLLGDEVRFEKPIHWTGPRPNTRHVDDVLHASRLRRVHGSLMLPRTDAGREIGGWNQEQSIDPRERWTRLPSSSKSPRLTCTRAPTVCDALSGVRVTATMPPVSCASR